MRVPHPLLRWSLRVIFWLCTGPLLHGQLPLEVDTSAEANKQPEVELGPNDKTPVVNITAPSPAGVSHNVFKEYNVEEEGIIYNNNPDREPGTPNALPPSYLAQDPLMVNPHLGGQAARVILTEVSGWHPSQLKGYTELYGYQVDYIWRTRMGSMQRGQGLSTRTGSRSQRASLSSTQAGACAGFP